MSSMLTDGGSAPVAVPVVRGRHLAPRPRVRWPLVGSLVARTTAPAEAHDSPHRSTKHRAQPAPVFATAPDAIDDSTAPGRTPWEPLETEATTVGADVTARHRTPLGRSASADGLIEVVVAEGETVADIAGRFHVSTASVLALNGISWRTSITAGSVILIRATQRTPLTTPDADSDAVQRHAVETGETVSAIAAGHGVSTAAILLANGLSRGSAVTHGQHLVIPRMLGIGPGTSTAEALALTGEMRSNASIIVSAGRALGVADDGVVAALAAAMQDSALRNLEFDGQDAGGLFHRPSGAGWGSMRDVLNPTHASRAFFGGPASPVRESARGLLDVPGWQLMSVGEAASVVQHDGTASAYAKWEHCAREWLRDLGRAI